MLMKFYTKQLVSLRGGNDNSFIRKKQIPLANMTYITKESKIKCYKFRYILTYFNVNYQL